MFKFAKMRNIEFDFFSSLVQDAHKTAGKDFAGLGLIYYHRFESLPVSPLRDSVPSGMVLPIQGKEAILQAIHMLNAKQSFYHDGFHLLNSEGLTHICQYFSPPIDQAIKPNYSKGGRFRAAQYGSCLPGVIATGVVGEDYGPRIFIQGETICL